MTHHQENLPRPPAPRRTEQWLAVGGGVPELTGIAALHNPLGALNGKGMMMACMRIAVMCTAKHCPRASASSHRQFPKARLNIMFDSPLSAGETHQKNAAKISNLASVFSAARKGVFRDVERCGCKLESIRGLPRSPGLHLESGSKSDFSPELQFGCCIARASGKDGRILHLLPWCRCSDLATCARPNLR